jgi:methionyl-tRNA formyltransferase
MRIVVAGGGELGAALLMALLLLKHDVAAVLQNGRRTRGFQRWWKPSLAGVFGRTSTVTGIAKAQGIPILWLEKQEPRELASLELLDPDLIITGGFGIIFGKPLLDLPRLGCLNCHGSLLPKHRGPNPYSAVILAGERLSGVSFHVMDEGIDTGPVVDQASFALSNRDNAGTAYLKAARTAAARLPRVLHRLETEGLRGAPQDEAEATYEPKLTAAGTRIDWGRPARDIDTVIRAGMPVAPANFRHGKHTVFVGRSEYDEADASEPPGTVLSARRGVRVATGEGTVLLRATWTKRPLPWLWPSMWKDVRPGDILE